MDERGMHAGWAGFNPRAALCLLPVIVFWVMRRNVEPEIAILAGFATSLVIFWLNRNQGRTVGALAVLGILIAGGATLLALVLEHEKIYLGGDAVFDVTLTSVLVISMLLRRPLTGVLAYELMPSLRGTLHPAHRVFFETTAIAVLVNLVQFSVRSSLLWKLSVEQYLIWNAAVTWPLALALFLTVAWLIRSATREKAPPSEAETAAA